MAHFVPSNEALDAMQVADLYFRKIVRFYGILKTITFNNDAKFVSHF